MKIFIAGGNSGIGILTAINLLRSGHTVTISIRDPKSRNLKYAEKLSELGAHVVEMDVTSDESVLLGVNQAISKGNGLDVIINTVGIFATGPQEAFTSNDWLRVFEINVLGAHRLNRAVLPTMRKQNFGVLVHISSLLGRFALPYCAPYCASKHALEALAEAYRRECAQFGVDSVIVEPGGFASHFFENALSPSDTSRLSTLTTNSIQSMNMWEAYKNKLFGNTKYHPQRVADAIENLLNLPHGQRPLRTVVDMMGLSDSITKMNNEFDIFTALLFSKMNLDFNVSIKE